MLSIGSEAPDFDLELDTGHCFRFTDQRSRKNVVLFFYPKDFTWGCTKEVCSLSLHHDEIQSFDAMIVGISADTAERHRQFSQAYHLPFPLGTDTGRSVSRLYDALLFGFRTRRLTYVIDKLGIIRGTTHHELRIESHWKAVVNILKTLDQP